MNNKRRDPWFPSKPNEEGGLAYIPKITRDPYRIIGTSSYDRYLDIFLKMWPDIKKAVPQATFHCFYGWQLFDIFYKNNPERMSWRNKVAELLKQDGVFDHGRVPQHILKEETLKSSIWAYCPWFGEINCISAQKSQAYGAIPVCVNYAALKETVKFGKIINVYDESGKQTRDIYDPEVQEEFKQALIDALTDHKWQEKVRKEMIPYALEHFTWLKTASGWDSEFRKGV